MALRGLSLFSKRFTDYRDAFILIGGGACDLWFADQNLEFRATKDLDIVLIIEKLSPEFITAFWDFVNDGEYETRNRNENGPPELFRFENPSSKDYPFRLELLSQAGVDLEVGPGQHIVPVRMENAESLSAILLNDAYYSFLLDHCRVTRGVNAADAMALIPLKVRAWLDLTKHKAEGGNVRSDDIKKHRGDVFRLAATLPGTPGPPLPQALAEDVRSFLHSFPREHAEWPAIMQSIRRTVGNIAPNRLVDAIETYFQLNENPE